MLSMMQIANAVINTTVIDNTSAFSTVSLLQDLPLPAGSTCDSQVSDADDQQQLESETGSVPHHR